jgi:5'-3' exonuclease
MYETMALRPVLGIDVDSFAHRAFHALPKSIRRQGGHGGSALVGFANFLIRLFEAEQPRAVLVGWDTLTTPTFREQLFPPYQGGRQFDPELVEQLELLPEFVTACGFAMAKAPGYEADDFLAAASILAMLFAPCFAQAKHRALRGRRDGSRYGRSRQPGSVQLRRGLAAGTRRAQTNRKPLL